MKDRLLEIMRLAYEVNDLLGLTFVSVDMSRYGALVHIHTLNRECAQGKSTDYWSPTQYAEAFPHDGWVIDPGLEKAETALKEILKGAKAA